MDVITVALLSVALAMDAFSVSVSCGMSHSNMEKQRFFVLAGLFGIFQFFMPLAGYLICIGFKDYLEHYIGIVGFIILFIIGCKMIAGSFKSKDHDADKHLHTGQMLILAVATSIDALAVGVTFTMYSFSQTLFACFFIGVTAFVLSITGILIGKKIGSVFNKAEITGGVILIIIGIKLLIESGIF